MLQLGIQKECTHDTDFWSVRCETEDRIYYICTLCLRGWHINKGKIKMNINDFAVEVSKEDDGVGKGRNIADIKATLRASNKLLDGKLYKMIREK